MKDPQIRELLWNHTLNRQAHAGTLVIPEMVLEGGAGRVDVATISPYAMVGYEIKSDHDTMKRVTAQLKRYVDVFDEIWFVCGPKYLGELLGRLPEFVGVLVVQENPNRLVEMRTALPNPLRRVRPITMLMHSIELRNFLTECGVKDLSKIRQKHQLVGKAMKEFSLERLSTVSRQALMERFKERGRNLESTKKITLPLTKEIGSGSKGRQLIPPTGC